MQVFGNEVLRIIFRYKKDEPVKNSGYNSISDE
jgi:hypothetical protein